MHQDLGFQPEDSVVTVIGAEAPHSVIYSADADDPEDAQKLLQVLAIGGPIWALIMPCLPVAGPRWF